MKTQITVESLINAPIEKVWEYWNNPKHITKWAFASDEWCAPRATNDLRVGGKFLTRMESKDGLQGFDFEGEYTNVIPNEILEYTIADGRIVNIKFEKEAENTKVTETFDAENENSVEMQKAGWQSILNNFKNYTEKN